MKTILLSIVILFASLPVVLAHGGKKHKKDSVKTADSIAMAQQHIAGDTVHHHDEGMTHDEKKVTADLADFPTLHPLIVHFAIVLIIVAAAMQLLNLYFMKKEISWIITAILFAGVLAAWFASKNFHPHTHGLTEHAKQVLAQHDRWADWTVNSGIVALILQLVNLFLFKNMRWAAATIAIVLAVSAYSVARAGHYGAQLVHIEGIGPQGKYLEMEHDH
ncbi:MAG TPA: hypothetical protein PLM56_02985 [Cyclobacteriaceae bacterium]|nr:hypothetical protein [Cyclobacteriaceae bacterium]HRF32439.1 hypothetical protein [Cyclobacteriaceae bacterium]